MGNPPFITASDLREELGSLYTETLWAAHPDMNESADYVLYWWDRAAEFLTRKGTVLRRFGLVTTNSISQVLLRRVVEKHLGAKRPVSLVFAIPDHPWVKGTPGPAAVRIAMTTVEAGSKDGVLDEVISEAALDTDDPQISFRSLAGKINSDVTVGVDVTKARKLTSNLGIAHDGVKLHGAGFIVTPAEAAQLGLGKRSGLERHIRPYRNGRDLTARSRGVMVIDLFGRPADEVRREFPEVYQHLLATVKLERDTNNRESYRANWWVFGEPRRELRPAVDGLSRYIATVDTARHRIFQFIPTTYVLDDKSVIVAEDDPAHLAILSSRIHVAWALRSGGWLGQGNDAVYTKSRTFDPFPFPEPSPALREKLRAAGEELDATRKKVLAEHPDLTLTGLYNVLEKVRAQEPPPPHFVRSPSPASQGRTRNGATADPPPFTGEGDHAKRGGGGMLDARDEDVKARGLVLILKELHDTIDRLTAEAYGWPADLSDEEILVRLVALNAERAREEAAGHVRWLRPEYQIPRFAKGVQAKTGEFDFAENIVAIDGTLPAWPADRDEQPLAIEALLAATGEPMDAAEIAKNFKRGGKRLEKRVGEVLATLARYGRVSALAGGRFAARRAA